MGSRGIVAISVLLVRVDHDDERAQEAATQPEQFPAQRGVVAQPLGLLSERGADLGLVVQAEPVGDEALSVVHAYRYLLDLRRRGGCLRWMGTALPSVVFQTR